MWLEHAGSMGSTRANRLARAVEPCWDRSPTNERNCTPHTHYRRLASGDDSENGYATDRSTGDRQRRSTTERSPASANESSTGSASGTGPGPPTAVGALAVAASCGCWCRSIGSDSGPREYACAPEIDPRGDGSPSGRPKCRHASERSPRSTPRRTAQSITRLPPTRSDSSTVGARKAHHRSGPIESMPAIEIPTTCSMPWNSPRASARRRKLELAVSLYDRGLRSFGNARAMAGCSKREFHRLLGVQRRERHDTDAVLDEDVGYTRG